MRKVEFLFIFLYSSKVGFGRVLPVFDEQYEICVTPEERAWKLDYSDLHLIAESDLDIYVNGSLRVLKEMKGPIKTTFYTEKFDRGEWHKQGMLRQLKDWCPKMMDPTEAWYFVSSKYKPNKCPYPAGTVWKINMEKITIPLYIPTDFVGKWRITLLWEYEQEGGIKECMRLKFDLVEV